MLVMQFSSRQGEIWAAGADNAAAAMEALDEEQLEQGAWEEDVVDIDASENDDVEAVGNEYEGGDDDDEGGWEMEV